jgi:hypothetical protein
MSMRLEDSRDESGTAEGLAYPKKPMGGDLTPKVVKQEVMQSEKAPGDLTTGLARRHPKAARGL